LSFNLWHALAEHRPIGINRLRKSVYEAVSAYRLQRNTSGPTIPELQPAEADPQTELSQ